MATERVDDIQAFRSFIDEELATGSPLPTVGSASFIRAHKGSHLSGQRSHNLTSWVHLTCTPRSVGARGGQLPRATRPEPPESLNLGRTYVQ